MCVGPGKHMTWSTINLQSPDQLRKRVAWSLSQIFSLGSNDIGVGYQTEPWVVYYDIFVANAFGSYRDIMQEISASPLMGRYLSMMGNAAFGYSGSYPDENFAREIMQLFSIGLYKLNMDGSQQLDASGRALNTYVKSIFRNQH